MDCLVKGLLGDVQLEGELYEPVYEDYPGQIVDRKFVWLYFELILAIVGL